MWTVYAHKNKANGKCYVGVTSQTIIERWMFDLKHASVVRALMDELAALDEVRGRRRHPWAFGAGVRPAWVSLSHSCHAFWSSGPFGFLMGIHTPERLGHTWA